LLTPPEAFLNSVRANLALSNSLSPPSPRIAASMSASPPAPPAAIPADLPSLDFVPAAADESVAGLRLVADSIAQRRQLASYALMTHPYVVGAAILLFSVVWRLVYRSRGDTSLVVTTFAGLLMVGFAAIRALVGGYLTLAEGVNFSWLDGDEVLVARWGVSEERLKGKVRDVKQIRAQVEKERAEARERGEEYEEGEEVKEEGDFLRGGDELTVIGTVVWKIVKGERRGKKRAVVRAWTTRQRMRGKGVGQGLIEAFVEDARRKGCAEIAWDEDSIYAKRVLPAWANGGFEEGLKESRKKFDKYVDAVDAVARTT